MAFSFLNQELAIDLGTANTVIFQNDQIVLDEPSIVAIDNQTGKCIALGQKAKLSAINVYVRLNSNRVMAGEAMIADAPASTVAVPNISYSQVTVTPELVVFTGIRHQPQIHKCQYKP